MLILTRRTQEGLVIKTSDGDVHVRVLGNMGNQVRLGFEAPKCINIVRDEVLENAPPVSGKQQRKKENWGNR